MDEVVDHQQKYTKEVSMCPNIFAGVVGLSLGLYSLVFCIQTEESEQSLVEFANSYVTILCGVINLWQAAISSNMDLFEKLHPWTFSAEALFQIIIMGRILKIVPAEDIENADLFAIYITIVIGIDGLLDNLTDFLLDLNEDTECLCAKIIQLFKVIYNGALAKLGKDLWDKAYGAWATDNL